MSYESPIILAIRRIEAQQMAAQEAFIKDGVFRKCEEYGLDVNMDELIKALNYDREQYSKGYRDRDEEIIRCKDCKYYEGLAMCQVIGKCMGTEGYCAWGEWRE